MDHQPDTSSHANSSQKGRFWVENSADTPQSARPRQLPGTQAHSDAGEAVHAHGPHQDGLGDDLMDGAEALPTLFELPDRTPETLLRKAQGAQYAIHDSHMGPPASHVDSPPGSHSDLSGGDPFPPSDPHSLRPSSADDSPEYVADLSGDVAAELSSSKLAAFNGSPMTWATSGNLAWIAKPAAISLMVILIPAAYLVGRNLNDSTPGPSAAEFATPNPLAGTTMNSHSEIDTVVLMPDDLDFGGSFEPDNPTNAAEKPVTAIAALAADENQKTSPHSAAFSPATIPSADAFPVADSTVHQPASATPLHGPPAPSQTALAGGSLGTPNLPPPDAPRFDGPSPGSPALQLQNDTLPGTTTAQEAMVAYRSESPELTSQTPAGSIETVPVGMGNRLRLEDGIRYTDTPHPIGNFLDILKTWESSEPQ